KGDKVSRFWFKVARQKHVLEIWSTSGCLPCHLVDTKKGTFLIHTYFWGCSPPKTEMRHGHVVPSRHHLGTISAPSRWPTLFLIISLANGGGLMAAPSESWPFCGGQR